MSLTFGAQTGRGSDRSCVIKRTMDYEYQTLIASVHHLAQNAAGAALPYLGMTAGYRYSITLYTPGKLERLTAQDWDLQAKAGFPIYLYEPLPSSNA